MRLQSKLLAKVAISYKVSSGEGCTHKLLWFSGLGRNLLPWELVKWELHFLVSSWLELTLSLLMAICFIKACEPRRQKSLKAKEKLQLYINSPWKWHPVSSAMLYCVILIRSSPHSRGRNHTTMCILEVWDHWGQHIPCLSWQLYTCYLDILL